MATRRSRKEGWHARLPGTVFRERNRVNVFSQSQLQPLQLCFACALALSGVVLLATSCGGSKANVRNDETNAAAQPAAVDVTTAPAIVRELPQFFEATGSLTGDEQTDVSPSIAGKVVSIGVDLGSYVKRGQTIVRLDDVDAKLRVQQAQAQVDQAKAALRQAEEKVGIRPGQSFRIEQTSGSGERARGSGAGRKESASFGEADRIGRHFPVALRPAKGAARSTEGTV